MTVKKEVSVNDEKKMQDSMRGLQRTEEEEEEAPLGVKIEVKNEEEEQERIEHLRIQRPDEAGELNAATADTSQQWKGSGFEWTTEEKVALLEGMVKHGLDWDKIKAESVARLI